MLLSRTPKLPHFSLRFSQIRCSSNEAQQSYYRPKSISRTQYDLQRKDERAACVVDASTGIKVTRFKRFFLVATGLYKGISDVPEYISSGTSNRLSDRLRIIFIITFVLISFTIFLGSELSVVRGIDREKNVIRTNN